VGLLNVGTEPKKGNSRTREAYVLFQKYVPGFCGNIEGTDLFAGDNNMKVFGKEIKLNESNYCPRWRRTGKRPF